MKPPTPLVRTSIAIITMLLTMLAWRLAPAHDCDPTNKYCVAEIPHYHYPISYLKEIQALPELDGQAWVWQAIVRKRERNIAEGLPRNQGTFWFTHQDILLAVGLRRGESLESLANSTERPDWEIIDRIVVLRARNWAGLHDIDWSIYQ